MSCLHTFLPYPARAARERRRARVAFFFGVRPCRMASPGSEGLKPLAIVGCERNREGERGDLRRSGPPRPGSGDADGQHRLHAPVAARRPSRLRRRGLTRTRRPPRAHGPSASRRLGRSRAARPSRAWTRAASGCRRRSKPRRRLRSATRRSAVPSRGRPSAGPRRRRSRDW